MQVEMARMKSPRIPVKANTMTIMNIMIVITILRYGNLINTLANLLPIIRVKKNPRMAAIRLPSIK